MAEKEGMTMTDVIKAAIGTEFFLRKQVDLGARVFVSDSDGNNLRELVLPQQQSAALTK
jgi:hypothetical protein